MSTTRPRVWLVAGSDTPDPIPDDLPPVRDTQMRVWHPGHPYTGRMTTADGRHHLTWRELRARFDLVETTRSTP